MNQIVALQPAFILRRRPYRETSSLLDLFTPEFGRCSLIAKGINRPRSALSGMLQPFRPLRLSWSAKSTLGILRSAEEAGRAPLLKGELALYGLYLNEILLKLLPDHEQDPRLFVAYQNALLELQQAQPEFALRRFEWQLLQTIGLLPSLRVDSEGKALQSSHYYSLPMNSLPQPVCLPTDEIYFSGACLLALAVDFQMHQQDKEIKRLLRYLIHRALQGKPLQSRDILLGLRRQQITRSPNSQ